MPFITRAGQADAPIDPGARTLCEPWDFGPRLKLWRLMVPWKPLPLLVPAILTVWPTSKASTVTVSPTCSSPASSRNSTRWRMGGALAFLRWPSSGLLRCFSFDAPKASCTASYPSRSNVRMPVTGHGPASSTVTRSTRPSSRNSWVIPSFLARIAGMVSGCLREYGCRPGARRCAYVRRESLARQPNLDVDARGQMVEPLQRVDRLRRRLVDVDQALVRPDLEVLPRVLVLEGRPDHAVDVLLRRQGDGTGHGGTGSRCRLDDLLRGRLDGRVVVRLQADADLVLGGCCHSVSVFCLLSSGSFVLALCAPKADPSPAGPAPPAAPVSRSGGGTAGSYRSATG